MVRIRSFSGTYFPAFGLNTDQKNSEYGPFLRSEMSDRFLNALLEHKSLEPIEPHFFQKQFLKAMKSVIASIMFQINFMSKT